MIGEKVGKYTILEIVGSGSMGSVYKAEDPEGRLVAVKVVRSQVLCSMEKRERFLQCLLVASEIRHAGICPILEIGDDHDDFFIIMPWIQGQTLEHYMERKPIPWRHALEIALSIGSALEAIHNAGAAHRGLKPANIWILHNSRAKRPSLRLLRCPLHGNWHAGEKPFFDPVCEFCRHVDSFWSARLHVSRAGARRVRRLQDRCFFLWGSPVRDVKRPSSVRCTQFAFQDQCNPGG